MSGSSSEESYYSSSSSEPEVDITINSIRMEGCWESFGRMPEEYLFHMIEKSCLNSAIVIVSETKNDPFLLTSSLSNGKVRFSKVPVDFSRSERIITDFSTLETFYGVRQEYKLYKPIPLKGKTRKIYISYVQITYKKKMGLFKKRWRQKIKTFWRSKDKNCFEKFEEWFKKALQNNEKYSF